MHGCTLVYSYTITPAHIHLYVSCIPRKNRAALFLSLKPGALKMNIAAIRHYLCMWEQLHLITELYKVMNCSV